MRNMDRQGSTYLREAWKKKHKKEKKKCCKERKKAKRASQKNKKGKRRRSRDTKSSNGTTSESSDSSESSSSPQSSGRSGRQTATQPASCGRKGKVEIRFLAVEARVLVEKEPEVDRLYQPAKGAMPQV